MRFIRKGNEPESFTNWKAAANQQWIPTYADLSNPEKRDVYNALLMEQGYICCYCERKLTFESGDYHIEHLNPQSGNNNDDLDFDNFLCSCLRTTVKGDPLHCGMKKGPNVIPITPLQPDCGENFIFTADGKIDGVNVLAKQTIEILALDISKLNDLREKTLELFLDPELSEDELREFIIKYVDIWQELNPFISMVKHIFREFVQG
jgi:uncharacterized protein (TIGR02646 family)